MRSTADVMEPIVPSLPHNARARSGPVEAARCDARVDGAAVGEHRGDADSSSKKPCRELDLPGVRTAIRPPSDDVGTTGG